MLPPHDSLTPPIDESAESIQHSADTGITGPSMYPSGSLHPLQNYPSNSMRSSSPLLVTSPISAVPVPPPLTHRLTFQPQSQQQQQQQQQPASPSLNQQPLHRRVQLPGVPGRFLRGVLSALAGAVPGSQHL